MKILIANIGSTSFKYRRLEMPGEAALAEGRVERASSASVGPAGTAPPTTRHPPLRR